MLSENLDLDIFKLRHLGKAVIDSCSWIYLDKLDLLDALLKEISLLVPAAVAQEIGYSGPQVVLKNSLYKRFTTADTQVVALATYFNCALISDDKKVLLKAKRQEKDYFNSLMMILLLYERGILSEKQTEGKLRQLKQWARYEAAIWNYGRTLFSRMVKKNKPR